MPLTMFLVPPQPDAASLLPVPMPAAADAAVPNAFGAALTKLLSQPVASAPAIDQVVAVPGAASDAPGVGTQSPDAAPVPSGATAHLPVPPPMELALSSALVVIAPQAPGSDIGTDAKPLRDPVVRRVVAARRGPAEPDAGDDEADVPDVVTTPVQLPLIPSGPVTAPAFGLPELPRVAAAAATSEGVTSPQPPAGHAPPPAAAIADASGDGPSAPENLAVAVPHAAMVRATPTQPDTDAPPNTATPLDLPTPPTASGSAPSFPRQPLEGSAAPAAMPQRQGMVAPAAQLAPALLRISHAPEGGQRLMLRLDPPELGHVEIRIDRRPEAPPRVEITVEKAETLTLLLRDQPQLHRALDQAGVPAEGRSVTFQVAAPDPPQRQGTEPATAPAFGVATGGPSGDGGASHRGGQSPHGRGSPAEADGAEVAAPAYWVRAGLDITA